MWEVGAAEALVAAAARVSDHGRAVQVASIKVRVESGYRFSA
jgi:hypothetical protein